MSRNCPNCGSPYDIGLNTCPYCGTSYFDMSCINFDERKPIYIKLKVNTDGNPMYITQKVIPICGDITIHHDDIDVSTFEDFGRKIVGRSSMSIDISFESVW